MKRLLFILALFMINPLVIAQTEEETETTEETEETTETADTIQSIPVDTTRFKIGDVEFLIIDHDTIPAGSSTDIDINENGEWEPHENKNKMTYWAGFDLGMNVVLDDHRSFNSPNSAHLQFDPAKSFNFSFNLLEQRIRIAKDYFGIVTGIGFTNSRFGFKDDRLMLGSTVDSTFAMTDTTLLSGYTKNQLRVNTFNIPLLLQFNFAKRHNKNFHIAIGAIGSVRMNSNVKYKYETVTGEAKRKSKGRYNLSAFQVAATARMGFRNFGLFANYHFLPLFEVGKSEVIYPVTFGMSFHI